LLLAKCIYDKETAELQARPSCNKQDFWVYVVIRKRKGIDVMSAHKLAIIYFGTSPRPLTQFSSLLFRSAGKTSRDSEPGIELGPAVQQVN
jgi:hypothetical protein